MGRPAIGPILVTLDDGGAKIFEVQFRAAAPIKNAVDAVACAVRLKVRERH